MKRFAFLLLAFYLMAAGCNETEQKPVLLKPKVTLEVTKTDIKTIDLTLSVLSSGNELDSWGIVYSETADREKGKEKVAEGMPSHEGCLIEINAGDAVKEVKNGKLADVAPTILKLMGIEQPAGITAADA